MKTILFLTALSAFVFGRIYLARLASEFIASLPDEERQRIQRGLRHSAC